MLARLDVCMGGRVAEEIIFGEEEITSGAMSDIQQATNLARAMVEQYGMSDEIGLVFHDGKKTSSEMKANIDQEVKKVLTASYRRAKTLLTNNRRQLEKIAEALLEYETLTGSQIKDLLAGKKIKINQANRPRSDAKNNPEASGGLQKNKLVDSSEGRGEHN